MNVKLKSISASLVIMAALMGNAYAAINGCPAVTEITQSPEGNGYLYKAAGPGGQAWGGENPMTDEVDLEKLKFTVAAVRSNAKGEYFVACDYEGLKKDGVRLIFKTQAVPNTSGAGWKNECKADDPKLCAFE
ncbi:Transmembrane protein [Pseudomonas syringae pv. cilantro]|uniref:Transmembrane protein n=2 Tax=Pseudomonas syringae group TaxID=136849 RepID=A0A0N0GCG0_PSESX|nr:MULTISPECIES: DUF3757 domain-containing protein [Pseudomonas syringae group]KPC23625.1 Transmembrane protein [Pseudomonas syringae pv. cilantro]KPW76967.1 Transmembrane protein [Pseudomonas syringae pv. coriandricola]RMN09645.1 Transmembrane protein [Pseudomonas syringae pv. coriandricola]